MTTTALQTLLERAQDDRNRRMQLEHRAAQGDADAQEELANELDDATFRVLHINAIRRETARVTLEGAAEAFAESADDDWTGADVAALLSRAVLISDARMAEHTVDGGVR